MGKLITKAEFQTKLDNKFGHDIYKLMDQYSGQNYPHRFRHECGNIVTGNPKNLLSTYNFLKCPCTYEHIGSKLKSKADKQADLDKVYGKNVYKIVGEYKGTGKHNDFRHSICGRIFSVEFSSLERKQTRCPCLRAPIKPKKPVRVVLPLQEKLDNKYGVGEYTLLSPYTQMRDWHNFQHKCGHVMTHIASNLLAGSNTCPCLYKPKGAERKTKLEVQQTIDQRLGKDEYKLLGKYLGAEHRYKFRHKCGEIIVSKLDTLYKKDNQCVCQHSKIFYRNLESHNEEVKKWRGEDWECLVFNKAKNGINHYRHKPCQNVYKTTLDSFRVGKDCPICDGFYASRVKKIVIDRKSFYVQGYEAKTLEKLAKKYNVKAIRNGQHPKRLKVTYIFEKSLRTYVPDFYIKKANLVVETKCLTTMGFGKHNNYIFPQSLFNVIKAKAKACLKAGFKFQLDLYSNNGKTEIKLPPDWMYLSRKKIEKVIASQT